MKTLFVCSAGRNRSHALNIHAKEMWSWDSVPAGIWGNPTIFGVLAPWAERIVLVERWWPEHFIPKEYCHKVAWLETGTDIWGHPTHPDLFALAKKLLLKWQTEAFRPGILITPSDKIEEIKDFRPERAT